MNKDKRIMKTLEKDGICGDKLCSSPASDVCVH